MKNVTLNDIVKACGGVFHGDAAALSLPVTSVVRDNREAAPGSLFAAFVGERSDGNDYIGAARAAGAVAALGSRPEKAGEFPYIEVADSGKALGDIGRWYRGSFHGPVIGISGSVGKTTAKEMIAVVLKERFSVLMTEKNLNNDLGVPLTVCRLDDSYDVAVVEMGISDFGEMDYLAGISRPDIGVLTNCGHAHLEALGDRRGVLKAKTEMMAHIPAGGLALLNGDDDLLRDYLPPAGVRRTLFGTEKNADVRAVDIYNGPKGCACTVGGCRLSSVYQGQHLVYSMLPAYAIGKELGMSDDEIAKGVAAFTPLAGRGNIVRGSRCTVIDHTYNANPSSTRAALASLSAVSGRKVAVLGDMYELGEDSRELHREVGRNGKETADLVIAVGELAEDIRAGAGAGCPWFPTVEEAIEALDTLIRPGDTVLVKASNAMKLSRIVQALQELA
ncbi:MAG: UDP-N-acetylmuramoyl-tripeptide--D-alanyl-D-alanine ligase [Firmicutes bacterium]|nr:UDP-N-acetylmuramoyl-tripeptide--D-alanyl-D-alanine ligase [Bacillota bacterium]